MAVDGELAGKVMPVNLMKLDLGRYKVILGMDWLSRYGVVIDCNEACVRIPREEGRVVFEGSKHKTRITVISMAHAEELIGKGHDAYLATIEMLEEPGEPKLEDVAVASEFADVFERLRGPPPDRDSAFTIELEPGTATVSRAPYRLAPAEIAELREQLEDLIGKGFIRPSSSP